MIETLTVVSDVEPDIAKLEPVLVPLMPFTVIDFGETGSMGEPAFYVHIDHDNHRQVVEIITKAGFRIVEGGQL